MEVIRLVRVDFDNMENHDASREEEVAIFGDDPEGKKARAKVDEWLQKNGPFPLYLGWDSEVYPHFRVERKFVQ